jgi:hypothetical protein
MSDFCRRHGKALSTVRRAGLDGTCKELLIG